MMQHYCTLGHDGNLNTAGGHWDCNTLKVNHAPAAVNHHDGLPGLDVDSPRAGRSARLGAATTSAAARKWNLGSLKVARQRRVSPLLCVPAGVPSQAHCPS